MPRDITRAQYSGVANIFTHGNGTYYFDRIPQNNVTVHQISEADFKNGNGFKVEVQYNVQTYTVPSKTFKFYQSMNRFDSKFTFIYNNPNASFSGDNAPLMATTDLPQEVYPNMAYFNNNSLTNQNPTIEELIGHEVGFHNMMGRIIPMIQERIWRFTLLHQKPL